MPASPLLANTTSLRAGEVGAWYDLVVTVGFVTPWTAALIFDLLRTMQTAWGLSGDVLPAFDGPSMMFINLFGAAVTMWSVARILRPVPWLVAIDTLGRLAFSVVFTGALVQGQSRTLVPFLALELAFLLWQGFSVRAALSAESTARRPPAGRRPQQVTARADAAVGH